MLLLFTGGCRFFPPPSPPRQQPLRMAGLIRQVNRAEHYFIFESELRFAPGSDMLILRNGQKIGEARVSDLGEKKFQAADILQGSPQPGDLCEPKLTQFPTPDADAKAPPTPRSPL